MLSSQQTEIITKAEPLGRGRVRYTVPDPTGPEPFILTFRIPDLTDIAEVMGAFPTLETLFEETEEEIAQAEAEGLSGREREARKMGEALSDTEKAVVLADSADRCLQLCALTPKLVTEFGAEDADGDLPVRAIPSTTRIALFMSLLVASGYSDQAAGDIKNFVAATGHGTSGLGQTGSPSATGDAPRSTSPLEESGTPTSV